MSKTRRIIKNTLVQGASQLITWGLSWVLLIVLPRKLGDADFGRFFFAYSYGAIFSVLINLGVNLWLTREVATLRAGGEGGASPGQRLRSLLGSVAVMKVLLALGVFALQSAAIYALPYDAATRTAVLIVGASTCLGALTLTLSGAFQGMELMTVPNLGLVVEKLMVTLGCVALLERGFGLIPVCWVHLAAAAADLAIVYFLLRRRIPFVWNFDLAQMRRVFLGGLPFLAVPAALVLKAALNLLVYILYLFTLIPGGFFYVTPLPSLWQVGLYYAFLLVLISVYYHCRQSQARSI